MKNYPLKFPYWREMFIRPINSNIVREFTKKQCVLAHHSKPSKLCSNPEIFQIKIIK